MNNSNNANNSTREERQDHIKETLLETIAEDIVRVPLKRLEELIRAETVYAIACRAYVAYGNNLNSANVYRVLFGPLSSKQEKADPRRRRNNA